MRYMICFTFCAFVLSGGCQQGPVKANPDGMEMVEIDGVVYHKGSAKKAASDLSIKPQLCHAGWKGPYRCGSHRRG